MVGKKSVKIETRLSEIAIQSCLTYMDYHLMLLKEALDKGDQENINFQKQQLEAIRQMLVEYEYFPPLPKEGTEREHSVHQLTHFPTG